MAERIEFVHVVDAEGNAIEGFSSPVPSHWIGTDLLPKGTKRAPEREDRDDQGDEIDDLKATVALLEDENASLRQRLVAATVDRVKVPEGNASTEKWAAYAVERGADVEYVKGRSRDQLREEFGPKQA